MNKGLLCFLTLLYGGVLQSQIVSNFNTNTEGWLITGNANGGTQPATYNATGGNPGGFISSTDQSSDVWYFVAPSKFLGNKSHFYGRNLKFDL